MRGDRIGRVTRTGRRVTRVTRAGRRAEEIVGAPDPGDVDWPEPADLPAAAERPTPQPAEQPAAAGRATPEPADEDRPDRPPDPAVPPLTYPEAVAALTARGRFGIRLGLGRTRALLRALDDPQAGIRGALIAGTNGKGSVQALVSAMLREAGYRVGQAPKPHLVEYRERIVVDGSPIETADMAALVARTLSIADRLPRRLGSPTEFEVVTAAAFAWFAERGVDVAVVEVGLGGRLDATNAWDGGVAAVTNVAMDHAEWLGGTIPLIAREKAAILKRGDLAVTGAAGEALEVVRRRAHRMGAPLVEMAPLPVLGIDRHGVRVDAPGLGDVRIGLLGRHQAANAAVALGVVDALEEAGIAVVPAQARRDGLAAARWPGRLELIELPGTPQPGRGAPAETSWTADLGRHGGQRRSVDLVLDGAHNPAGARALAEALDELRPSLAPGPAALLLAIMRDKDVSGMVERLVAAAALREARLVATRVTARGMDPAELAAAWRAALERASAPAGVRGAQTGRRGAPADRRCTQTGSGRPGGRRGAQTGPGNPGGPVDVVPSPEEALDHAIRQARAAGGPLVVAGSLYLVGAVRGILQSRGLVR